MPPPINKIYSATQAGVVRGGRFASPAVAINSARYRDGQPYLFDSILAAEEPIRIGSGTPLNLDRYGPTVEYANHDAGLLWDNLGGDWIDATSTRMGTTPWASVYTPSTGAAAEYSADVTAALQLVQGTGRWNAWIMRRTGTDGPRTIAGNMHTTSAYRPRIEVTYTDATTATLACRVSANIGSSSTLPSQSAVTMAMNAALGVGAIAYEFALPAKPVSAATIYVTVTNHWSSACTLAFDLADPPRNTDPVTTGVASSYPLDNGLAGEASIIGVHRYVDGSALADFSHPTQVNHDNDYSWSPDVFETGAANTSLMPYLGLGKFVHHSAYSIDAMSLVESDHVGGGFTPLAPGLGALRIVMPKMVGIEDGVEVGYTGTGAANSFINMPIDKIGTLSRIFVRYYLLIGTTADTGSPYRATLAQQYQVLKGGTPTWTDMAGKLSVISPAHKTATGGNSGTSGGGKGWVLRPHWTDYVADTSSPSAGGWMSGFEWDDFQSNNPTGHNYNVGTPAGYTGSKDFIRWGQRGGLGAVLYAGYWYCIEQEMQLNTIDDINGVDGRYWTPDGECRVWIDGRLAYEVTGFVVRSLPADDQPSGYPQSIGKLATLGIKHLWFNWYHGGTTQNSIDREIFISGLAWGTARIGPMQMLPAWVPEPGEMARFTVGGGVLTNNFRDVIAPYFSPYYDTGIVNDYSGPGYAPDIGAYGAILFYGGGHSATNNGQVVMLTPDAAGLTFSRITTPTAWTGSTATDDTNKGNNSYSTSISSLVDGNWGDAYPHDATYAPPGIHSYSANVVIPNANGGATYGTLFSPMVAGGGVINITTLGGSHELAITSLDTSNTWARAGSTYFGTGTGWQGPLLAAYVPAQDRVYWGIGNAGTNVRWYDRDSGDHEVGSSSGMVPGTDYNTGQYIHVPTRDLLLHVERNAGYLRIRWMAVGAGDTNPSVGGTAALGTALPLDPFEVGKTSHWAAACWCPDTSRLIVAKALTTPGDLRDNPEYLDHAAVYEIELPADLGDDWPVTRRVFTGITDAQWDVTTWQQPVYMPAIKCLVYFQRSKRVADGADSILVYRPVGT